VQPARRLDGLVEEHQRRTAAALVVALHDLGDRVGLYAFRSRGRGAVTVIPVKRLDMVQF